MDINFADRILLAHESLVLRYERRDGFLSDDDVLDAAVEWSPEIDDDLADEAYYEQPAMVSYQDLRDALFALLTVDDQEDAA